MPIERGTRFGPYEIQSAIGSGGMGEVYKARDTRLDRVVAIKVLRAHLAGDPDRRARFEREARLISQLNHPHICTLHDVGRDGETDYLVVEFLDGQSLADRLVKGPLPLAQALEIAIEIASALDAAHRQGIVHRDLKPANVMLTKSGAKLLDFGIARAVATGTAAAAPTLTSDGALLGTVQYMSPEQLEGRDADSRSDLFALGAVLYEMLSGRRAFPGESQASVIASVLDGHPAALHSIGASVPPALEHLISTCLAKNPDERWQSAGDIKRQLEWIAAGSDSAAGPQSNRRGRAASAVAAVATVVALAAGAALIWYVRTARQQAGQPQVTRTTIATSGAAALSVPAGRSLAITPDGRRIVYVGNNGTQLFVRPLDRLESTAIFTSTAPLNQVSVSSDGQSVVVGEGNTLKKIALTGGPAVTITSPAGYGAAWLPDNTIVFASVNAVDGLRRVSSDGGDVTVLARADPARGESAYSWPEPLPGGHAVLFTIAAVTGGLDASQIAVLDLKTGVSTVLVRGGSHAHYVPGARGGHLVFVKGTTLQAVAFDPVRLEIRGTPVAVLQRLVVTPIGSGHFDVAADGTLAYLDGETPDPVMAGARTLVWVDRQGRQEPLAAPPRPYGQPRISPDETLVATTINDRQNDIWLWDVARRMLTRLTTGPTTKFFPVWMPDGQRLIFSYPGAGLYWQRIDGTGAVERLGANSIGLASSVTKDGSQVIFAPGARDLMLMTLETGRVTPLIQTPATERNGVVSPDGRWLAYESDSSGGFEIYVTPFPKAGEGQRRISTDGGTRPLWARNGHELFYVAPAGAIMSARVDVRGGAFSAGTPEKVVEGPYATGAPASGRNYDVSSDGRRFLMVRQAPATQAGPQLVVVQNWAAELERLVP